MDSMSDHVHRKKKQSISTSERNVFGWLARTAALRTLTSITYLFIRFRYTLQVHWELSVLDKLVAWVFLLTEIGIAVTRVGGDLQSWTAGGSVRSRPHLYFDSQVAPTVNVLITYCGEGLELLMDTVRAACALDYPRERFWVVVLDDSCSSETKSAVQELAMIHTNLRYTSRGVEVDTHSKAANLNHGLIYTKSLDAEGKDSELVAGLDVDMIPNPRWLKILVPHVMEDDHVAMAFIPQSYYNIPLGDPLRQMLAIALFQEIRGPQLDALHANLASGSGYVARRVAIDDIGGIPEDTVAEDWVASMKLGRAGWKIVYVKESLQWGLVPDSFAGHLKQRRRWQEGILSTADTLHQFFSKSPRWELKIRLRLLLFETSVALLAGVNVLCFFAIPLILLSRRVLILQQSHDQLKLLLRLAMVDIAAQTLHGALMAWQTHFTIHVFHIFSEMWLYVYLLPTLLRHWTPKWSLKHFANMPKFTPGGSAASRSPERDNLYRHHLFSRLRLILWDYGAFWHLLVLVGTLAGCWITFRDTQELEGLLIRGGWPHCVLMWTSVISSAWVPINYAIAPPEKSRREGLLTRDPVTDVAYPTQKARQSSRQRVAGWQVGCVLIYMCFVALQVL